VAPELGEYRRAVTPEEIVAFVEGLAASVASAQADPQEAALALRRAAATLAELSQNGKTGTRRSFWEHVCAQAYPDEASIREAASAVGVRLAPTYLAVALEVEETDGAVRTLPELRKITLEVFAPSDADVGTIEGLGTLNLLIPVGREIDASNARTAAVLLPKTLVKRHAEFRISGGVGGAAPVIEITNCLERAGAALAIGRRIFGPGRVSVYDDLGAYALLYSGASVEELRGFSRRVLAPLRDYDEKHQTELERTLRRYFALGQNVKTAAAELNVHRHTVFYRLRQIAEICRCDLGAPHDQLTLRLAMAIDALHS